MAGKKIAIVTGQSVTFGRAAGRAEFALPHDTFMSGVHFAVECGTSGCRVQDRKSSNGTFLNGAKIQDAMLDNGDETKGGQTIFTVRIVADAKLASLLPPQELAPLSGSQQQPFADEPFGLPQQRARLRSILLAAAPQAYEPCRIGNRNLQSVSTKTRERLAFTHISTQPWARRASRAWQAHKSL
jgi:FHA domain-containing protein